MKDSLSFRRNLWKRTRSSRLLKLWHAFLIRLLDWITSWVIYIIDCNICKLQYIGKSKTTFNLRLNNHHIKKGISSCELTEHFLHNKWTHNLDNNVIITIIEQLRKDNISNEQKKDLLRHREIFWQKKLNSMQPNGLTKQIGWPFKNNCNYDLNKVLGPQNVFNIRCKGR